MSLAGLLAAHRVIVCVGSGGVGKTTTAAALALAGALEGRKAMVLTIDPAKRLAQSLGLDSLRSGGEPLDPALFERAGLNPRGRLSAGVLEQQSAWDEFIARHAPSAEIRDAILNNEFYRHLSSSFAGSAEYMAIEELCRIEESGEHDLIVLDTPPTGHALDFLEAPRRLEDFLDRSVVGWFVRPYAAVGWSAWKTTSRTVRFLLQRIEQATGIESLRQISEFFVSMERLFDGIAERSRKVRALLASPTTAFVLVAGPEEQVLGESDLLTAKMRELGMPLKGVVMNRVQPMPCGGESEPSRDQVLRALKRWLVSDIGPEELEWLADAYENACRSARAQELRCEAFEVGLGDEVVAVRIPELEADVHDLASLAKVARLLMGEGL
ncbi:MAG: ArsA family ATPase [Candidatus Dadabacteria bacterium]|nr:MAG: ArsA family ATPase [Candidatus Dadabacteria bacterium]